MDINDIETLLAHCPGGITIKPHNPNLPGSDVTIQARASIKHPRHGTFQYAEIYIARQTLREALSSASHMVLGYKALVDSAP